MITIYHGDDTAESRNAYFTAKQKTTNATTLNGATVTLEDLQQALSGEDLFGDKKPIFIEDLLSKRKGKDLDGLISLFQSSIVNDQSSIFLWESKTLTPKQAGLFKGATIREFKIPSTIFAFLDLLRPGNGKMLVEQFHKTLEDKEAEFVLFMLTRQIRMLLALSAESHDGQTISEVARLAPWQRGKLDKQAKSFTKERLIDLHSKLYELEFGMKTGGLVLPMKESIDMLLLTI